MNDKVDPSELINKLHPEWALTPKRLPTVPDDKLPALSHTSCRLLGKAADVVAAGELAVREFQKWASHAMDKRGIMLHLLSPKQFKKFWSGDPVLSASAGLKRVCTESAADGDVKASDEPSKKQKLLQEAQSLNLLPHNYDLDTKVRSKVLGDRAMIMAHVMSYRMDQSASMDIMVASTSSWPKSGSVDTALPRDKMNPSFLVAMKDGKGPVVRHLLPREVFSMKGYHADCLNMSSCSRAVSFQVCKNLPYEPVLKSWVLAALTTTHAS